jgi:hypothetical protein
MLIAKIFCSAKITLKLKVTINSNKGFNKRIAFMPGHVTDFLKGCRLLIDQTQLLKIT